MTTTEPRAIPRKPMSVNERQAQAADARAKGIADLAANRNGYNRATPPISAESAADDAAPLFTPDTLGKAQLATLPEPPAAAKPVIILSTTVIYRGRQITISNDGMTLDQFCDLLDRRLPL